MPSIDLILLVILAIAGVLGFRKGFVAQVTMFIALLLGIWACLRFSNFTAAYLAEHFAFTRSATMLWAFGITFAITVLAVYFIGILASRFLKILFLAWLNRLLGLIFGVLKMALILSVIISTLSYAGLLASIIAPENQQKSLLFSPISRFAPAIYPTIRHFTQKTLQHITQPTPTLPSDSSID